jgi:hypothetical protein
VKRAIVGAIALTLAAGAAQAHAPWLPNPRRTPGAVDPSVTRAMICDPSWSTRSIRPPEEYTYRLKRAQLRGEWGHRLRTYEEDHLIPLELGGAPRARANLWPQPRWGACSARRKDELEDQLRDLVCDGRLGLHAAQQAISSDWTAAYRRFVGPLQCRP